MLLAINVGNTNTTFAVFDGEHLAGQWRLATDAERSADEYDAWLAQHLGHEKLHSSQIKGVIVACVVAPAMPALRELAKQHFHTALMVVGHPEVKTGISIAVDAPGAVGADRLVNASAAWKRCQQACMAIDIGTAATFDLVNANGEFIGGAIAPGPHAARKALQKAVSFPLPDVPMEPPAFAIGATTADAMQTGLFYGYAGLVERIAAELLKAYGAPMKIIATGGAAAAYAGAVPAIMAVEPDLTIIGLKDIYALNKA